MWVRDTHSLIPQATACVAHSTPSCHAAVQQQRKAPFPIKPGCMLHAACGPARRVPSRPRLGPGRHIYHPQHPLPAPQPTPARCTHLGLASLLPGLQEHGSRLWGRDSHPVVRLAPEHVRELVPGQAGNGGGGGGAGGQEDGGEYSLRLVRAACTPPPSLTRQTRHAAILAPALLAHAHLPVWAACVLDERHLYTLEAALGQRFLQLVVLAVFPCQHDLGCCCKHNQPPARAAAAACMGWSWS